MTQPRRASEPLGRISDPDLLVWLYPGFVGPLAAEYGEIRIIAIGEADGIPFTAVYTDRA